MIYRASGNATVVESRGLLRVQYNQQGSLNISLSTLYYNATCGLCGVFNGNSSDDLRLPSGRLADSAELFSEAWRAIADDLTCNGDCDDLYRMCTDLRLYQSPWMCGHINDPGNSSFLACHSVVNPSPFFRNCLYNMCVKEGNRSALCSSLQAYASACQDAQVGITSWRSATNCRKEENYIRKQMAMWLILQASATGHIFYSTEFWAFLSPRCRYLNLISKPKYFL